MGLVNRALLKLSRNLT